VSSPTAGPTAPRAPLAPLAPTAPTALLARLVGFARALRAAGVDAGPDRVQAMVAALKDAPLHPELEPAEIYCPAPFPPGDE